MTGGEAGGEQVAAGGRFPIQHFAGAENAGQCGQHVIVIQSIQHHAARGADGLVHGPRRAQRDGQGFEGVGQAGAVAHHGLVGAFAQQAGLDAGDAKAALQVAGEGTGAPRPRHFLRHPLGVPVGQQIEAQHYRAIPFDAVAQAGGKGVDQAAFEARGAHHALALAAMRGACRVGERGGDGLQRFAGVAGAEVLAPGHVEAAIGGPQGGHRHPGGVQQCHPAPVGAELGPAATAEGQQHGVCDKSALAVRCGEAQLPAALARCQTQPAMAHLEAHALLAQSMQPGAQQGRRLHF